MAQISIEGMTHENFMSLAGKKGQQFLRKKFPDRRDELQ